MVRDLRPWLLRLRRRRRCKSLVLFPRSLNKERKTTKRRMTAFSDRFSIGPRFQEAASSESSNKTLSSQIVLPGRDKQRASCFKRALLEEAHAFRESAFKNSSANTRQLSLASGRRSSCCAKRNFARISLPAANSDKRIYFYNLAFYGDRSFRLPYVPALAPFRPAVTVSSLPLLVKDHGSIFAEVLGKNICWQYA